jgi:hypothetical protein
LKLLLRFFAIARSFFIALALTSALFAQSLTGTITNGTTNKPGAGDEVVLITLANGMQEAGRTKADASGKFHFDLKDAGGPHLIRAIHQGVTYHRMAPPGTPSVELQVYDAAQKVLGLNVTADVMRLQADQGQLQIVRLFAIDNQSTPPRTQQSDQNFEFFLPDGATIDNGQARAPNGQPISNDPVPQKTKNKYAFNFPLRPGETQFQIAYHLPYSGEASLDPKLLYPAEHFVVEMPKTMQFTPAVEASFQTMPDPQMADAVVHVAQKTAAGQNLAFKIGGTAAFAGENQAGSTPQANDNRPGGGLGAPIDAPDPLDQYKFPILAGLTALMALGAFYVMRRPRPEGAAAGVPSQASFEPSAPVAVKPAIASAAPKPGAGNSAILEALKDELFQLEVERKQGKLSHEEYDKARNALDHTLERALKRQG